MFKEIGRLDVYEVREVEDYMKNVFTLLDNNETSKVTEMIEEVCKTNNYFLRELVGKLFTEYNDQDKMAKIASEMLESKVYGLRATALFFFFNKYYNNPDKLVTLLEENFESVPWEVESIVYELWKKNPKITKNMAPKWLKSDNEKKRIISFHGLELIVESDTIFVLDFLGDAIDDTNVDVQKKITHIILQIVKSKPAETYAYIREWIMTGSERRVKNLQLTLKKIISMYSQKNSKDKPADFVTLTKFIINDWKSEPNRKIANVAQKLTQALKSEKNNYYQ